MGKGCGSCGMMWGHKNAGKDWKTRCRGRRWLTVFENTSKHVKRALNVKRIGQNWGKMFKNGRKHTPRAQTTCMLSFGPFPIVVAFHLSLYCFVTPACAHVVVVRRLAMLNLWLCALACWANKSHVDLEKLRSTCDLPGTSHNFKITILNKNWKNKIRKNKTRHAIK